MYTKKVNSRIQRHEGAVGSGSSSVSSEDVEERKQLLQDTINEPEIVKVKTT